MSALPPAAAPFPGFARLLRRHGFAVAPEQIVTFMRAISLLGPRSLEDIRQAAYAALAPPVERHAEFDALFRAWFIGAAEPAPPPIADDTLTASLDPPGEHTRPELPEQRRTGRLAAAAELLADRHFPPPPPGSLRDLEQGLRRALPLRRSFRREKTRARGAPDLRRSFPAMVRNDGDVPHPVLTRRRPVPRKLLLLIDVSGSMQAYTADALRLAHAALRATADAEVFTLGTRLTHITQALRAHHLPTALERAAREVADWDGGTKLGPTLATLLARPRFAELARGASVVLISDALERGDPATLVAAARRLRGLAYRLSLATPLAADPSFRPETAALRAILPLLDDLVDGSSLAHLSAFLLSLARPPRNSFARNA
ncbi:MAG: vWA domain-containing protein [Acetobacteraceae bacterium]